MKNRVVQCYIPCCGGGVLSLQVLPHPEGAAQVFVGGGDGSLTYCVGATPKELRDAKQVRLEGAINSLSLSPDHVELMAVTTLGLCFRVRTKDLSFMLHSHSSRGRLTDVRYPCGISDLFLTCGTDGLVTLWDANDYSVRFQCGGQIRGSVPICCAGSPEF